MKATLSIALALLGGLCTSSLAQSTTGGSSGGSTASTGATYSTSEVRAPAGSPASMTVADEGASSSYIIGKRVDPDKPAASRAKSPDGSTSQSGVNSSRSATEKTNTSSQAGSRKTRKNQSKPR